VLKSLLGFFERNACDASIPEKCKGGKKISGEREKPCTMVKGSSKAGYAAGNLHGIYFIGGNHRETKEVGVRNIAKETC